MANQYYPRRMRVVEREEKRLIQRLVITIGLIVILGAAIFFGGVPALLSVGNLFNHNTSPAPIQSASPLIAPRLDPLDNATNSAKIAVTGSGQAGATVQLFVNNQGITQQVVGNDGSFSFSNIQIKEGTNTISAKQTINGRTSIPSSTQTIVYDNTPPALTVNSPQDNQTINGGSKNLPVTGKTDSDSTVTVNDAIATVGKDGSFSATIPLNQGGQTITIVATDTAGNQTTITRNVTYNP